MKISEAPATTVQTEIAAPIDLIWPLVTDIELPAKYSDEFIGATWNDNQGCGLGSTFTGRSRLGDSTWQTSCTVTDYKDNETFEWTVNEIDNPAACWRFDLEPKGDQTQLKFTVEIGPGPSGLKAIVDNQPSDEEQIVKLRLENFANNMAKTLAGIKSQAEESSEK